MLELATAIGPEEYFCVVCGHGFGLNDDMPICIQGMLHHASCVHVRPATPRGVNSATWSDPDNRRGVATIQAVNRPGDKTYFRPVVIRKGPSHTPDAPEWHVSWVVGTADYPREVAQQLAAEHAKAFGLRLLSEPPRGLRAVTEAVATAGCDLTSGKGA